MGFLFSLLAGKGGGISAIVVAIAALIGYAKIVRPHEWVEKEATYAAVTGPMTISVKVGRRRTEEYKLYGVAVSPDDEALKREAEAYIRKLAAESGKLTISYQRKRPTTAIVTTWDGNTDLGHALIRYGYARAVGKTLTYRVAEAFARREGRGMWRQKIQGFVVPEWDDCPVVHQSNRGVGVVLTDIDSRMPDRHIYRDNDRVTWGHETSHGIASRLRMAQDGFRAGNGTTVKTTAGLDVFKSTGRENAFYVLLGRSIRLTEPDVTLADVARAVPRSLRGRIYNLYLVQQQRDWNDTPLYVFDEWVAYTNGADVRYDEGIAGRDEAVDHMVEMMAYGLTLATMTDDPKLEDFARWQALRAVQLFGIAEDYDSDRGAATIHAMRTAADAERWRAEVREALGDEWTQMTLGF